MSWVRLVSCAACAIIVQALISPSNGQELCCLSAAEATASASGQRSSEQPAHPAHPVLKRLILIPRNAAIGVLEVAWVVKLAVTGEDMWSDGYHRQKRKEATAASNGFAVSNDSPAIP